MVQTDQKLELLTPAPSYWPEIPQSLAKSLTPYAQEHGWKQALDWVGQEANKPWLLDLATHFSRIRGLGLLPIQPEWKVLDFGAGWGVMTAGLAHKGCQTVALEAAFERAAFLAERIRQEGLEDRVKVYCGGNTAQIPFPDQAFDCVVVNGVLEWIPTSMPGHPA